jgi:hypothetical protein
MDNSEIFTFCLPYILIISAVIFIIVLIYKRKKFKRIISIFFTVLTTLVFGLGVYLMVMQWLPVYYMNKYSLNLDEYEIYDCYFVTDNGFKIKNIQSEQENLKYEIAKIDNLSPGDWILYGKAPYFLIEQPIPDLYKNKSCIDEPIFDWEIEELSISSSKQLYKTDNDDIILLLIKTLKVPGISLDKIEPKQTGYNIEVSFKKTSGFIFRSEIYSYEKHSYIEFKDSYYQINNDLLSIIKPFICS